MAVLWGKRMRKRLLAEDVRLEQPEPDPEPMPPEDPEDDEDLEEEEDDKPAARAVPVGISKVQREARIQGYQAGYEEAYRVARQCAIGGMSLKEALPYLQHGYSLEDVSEDIAERRAEESDKTAIRSESLPNTGTGAQQPRKVITAADRRKYDNNFNRPQKASIDIRMPRD